MLKGKEPSPIGVHAYSTINMTHPYSVPQHVQSLPDSSQAIVKSNLADNLTHMLYLKRLESLLDLYDCYDPKDEKSFRESFRPSYAIMPTMAFAVGAVASCVYLKRTCKLPLLQFETYVNKLYGFLFVFGFSYFGFKVLYGSLDKRTKNLDDFAILSAKSKLHTDSVKINNSLRFSLRDTY